MPDSSSKESLGDYIIIRISPPSSPPSRAANYPTDDELKKEGLELNRNPDKTPDQKHKQEIEQQAPFTNGASPSPTKKPMPKSEDPVTMRLLEEEQEDLGEAWVLLEKTMGMPMVDKTDEERAMLCKLFLSRYLSVLTEGVRQFIRDVLGGR